MATIGQIVAKTETESTGIDSKSGQIRLPLVSWVETDTKVDVTVIIDIKFLGQGSAEKTSLMMIKCKHELKRKMMGMISLNTLKKKKKRLWERR